MGLALGSGGFRGLAHIGVLKVLVKEKIPIDFLAGSSAGAIVAAYFAVHKEIESLERWVLGLKKVDLARLVDLTPPKEGLIKGERIHSLLEKLFEHKTFSQLQIPLTILATDLRTGEEVYLQRGSVAKAVLASSTLPGALPPVRIGKGLLVDGGAVNPTPVDVVKKMGADVAIGVDLTMTGKVYLINPNILEILLRSFDVLRSKTTKLATRKVGKDLVIIKPKINGTLNLLYYFDRREEIIFAGEKAARQKLGKIRKMIGID